MCPLKCWHRQVPSSSVGILVYSEETSRVQRMQSLGNLVDSMYLINSFVSFM